MPTYPLLAVLKAGCLIMGFWLISCQKPTSPRLGTLPADAPKLWDSEVPLATVARECSLQYAVSRTNPQPMGMTESDGTPNLSNPKMTIALWGPPDQLTLSINKNDVWDRRMGRDTTVTLAEMKAGYFSPVNADNSDPLGFTTSFYPTPEGKWVDPYASWRVYPFPCIKPVGQVAVLADDFKASDQPTATIRMHNGLTEVNLTQGTAQGKLDYLVMMEQNVIAIRGDFKNLDQELKLRFSRHRDTYDPKDLPMLKNKHYRDYNVAADSAWNQRLDPPESGREGKFFWIKQKMPAEKTFPKGFEYVLVGLIDGEEYSIETLEGAKGVSTLPQSSGSLSKYIRDSTGAAAIATFPKQRDHQFTAYTTVVTTNDANDLLAEAKKRLLTAQKAGFKGLTAKNEAWYTALYTKREKGRIFTGNSEDVKAVMPGHFFSWMYDHSLTSPDPTQYEAQAKGYSLLELDAAPWHSLPCYNELFMSTPLAVANRTDLLNYYVKLIGMWHETARKNAQEVFDLPGLYVGHGYLPPIKTDTYPHSHLIYELSMDMPAQLLKYIWDVWDYEGDTVFLQEKVYPVMKDLATLYAAFLTKEQDGRYHIVPTIPQERWVFNYRFKYNRDATTSIAMFRWTFLKAAEAAAVLGVDEDLQAQWIALSKELPPYPKKMTATGPVWMPVAGDPLEQDYSIGCLAKISGMMAPVTLTNEVNLDSSPSDTAIALRSARFHDPVVWDKNFTYHLLGQAKDQLYRYVGTTARWQHEKMLRQMKPSPDGYRILATYQDHVNACWLEPERLLNSRSGRIHLYPCVPDDFTVGFRKLLASGGFKVSSELRDGKVTFLEISARRSIPCRIVNPWPTKNITIIDTRTNRRVPVVFDSATQQGFSFTAEAGGTYSISLAAK